jgi:hypothetical protein
MLVDVVGFLALFFVVVIVCLLFSRNSAMDKSVVIVDVFSPFVSALFEKLFSTSVYTAFLSEAKVPPGVYVFGNYSPFQTFAECYRDTSHWSCSDSEYTKYSIDSRMFCVWCFYIQVSEILSCLTRTSEILG